MYVSGKVLEWEQKTSYIVHFSTKKSKITISCPWVALYSITTRLSVMWELPLNATLAWTSEYLSLDSFFDLGTIPSNFYTPYFSRVRHSLNSSIVSIYEVRFPNDAPSTAFHCSSSRKSMTCLASNFISIVFACICGKFMKIYKEFVPYALVNFGAPIFNLFVHLFPKCQNYGRTYSLLFSLRPQIFCCLSPALVLVNFFYYFSFSLYSWQLSTVLF